MDHPQHTSSNNTSNVSDLESLSKFSHSSSTSASNCPIQGADVWCNTQMSKVKFNYIWTIENYSLWQGDGYEVITSSVFSSPQDDNMKWCLRMSPKGLDDESRDYISLYLVMINSGDSSETFVKFKFSLVGSTGEELTGMESQKAYRFVQGKDWGFKQWIRRDMLMDSSKIFIPNDRLTIFCEVQLWYKTMKSVSCTNRRRNFIQVPEPRLADDLYKLLENGNLTDAVLLILSPPPSSSAHCRCTLCIDGTTRNMKSAQSSTYTPSVSSLTSWNTSATSHSSSSSTALYTHNSISTLSQDVLDSAPRRPYSTNCSLYKSDVMTHPPCKSGEMVSRDCDESASSYHQTVLGTENRMNSSIHGQSPITNKVPSSPSVPQSGRKRTFKETSHCSECSMTPPRAVPPCHSNESKTTTCEMPLSHHQNPPYSLSPSLVVSRKFHVHKAILAARSSVFAEMFRGAMQSKEVTQVEITDVDPDTMGAMIHFIYTAKVNVSDTTSLCKLLQSAIKYDLSRLQLICQDSLMRNLSRENCCEILRFSDDMQDDLLKSHVKAFVLNNVPDVIENSAFLELFQSRPHLLTELFRYLAWKGPQPPVVIH